MSKVAAPNIDQMVDKMTEETFSEYRVANSITIDWCPCCGVNMRLYDDNAKLFAKWISDPCGAKALGRALIRVADDMMKQAPAQRDRDRLYGEMTALMRRRASRHA